MHPSLQLNQDANVYVSESDPGKAFNLQLSPGRQAYLVRVKC